jgi:hypothetical protein
MSLLFSIVIWRYLLLSSHKEEQNSKQDQDYGKALGTSSWDQDYIKNSKQDATNRLKQISKGLIKP